ncbi:GNAT family N-acetyltransferase [Acinetobacter sp. ANC 3813]|nr:GNAT family N-acetyltransferase [Acinetobacter sp. ANC 3813]
MGKNMPQFQIHSGRWAQLEQDAKRVREQVFIQEQQIAPEDEWDAEDSVSQHFMVYDHEQPIATARLLNSNSIGRVAVLKAYRGKGIGKLLMEAVILQARAEGRKFVKLSSQVHAVQFYSGLGFSAQGEEYLDCGIPHIDMQMQF